MFSTFEKVKALAKKQGLSLNQLEERLGYSKNTLYGLKTSIPKSDRIEELADYFNVSTDYLLGRTDTPYIATDSENSLMDTQELNTLVMFRKETDGMSEEEKERFNKALAGLMQTARSLIEDDSNWK